eukprot:6200799-Pleurochrysis_carterae.AAC.2
MDACASVMCRIAISSDQRERIDSNAHGTVGVRQQRTCVCTRLPVRARARALALAEREHLRKRVPPRLWPCAPPPYTRTHTHASRHTHSHTRFETHAPPLHHRIYHFPLCPS